MISDPYIRSALQYAGAILLGALAAGLGALAVQLNGTDPIVWRPILAATLGPIVTGLIARQLTRAGSEGIAAQVNDLRAEGYRREDMTVTVPAVNVPPVVGRLTPEQLNQVAGELERRMRATPAARDQDGRI